MKIFITILLAYLIGSFSSAYFIGKMFRDIDIRNHGSGNAGATNAIRVMGKKLGVVTFFLDLFKGIVAVIIGRMILGSNGGLIAGLIAVIGHNWPIFLQFRGGKGVATSLGVILILHWPTALICSLIGLIVGLTSKYVSLGSVVFLSTTPIINALIMKEFSRPMFITTFILALLTIYRHRSNFQRIINGTENKIGR